MIRLFFGNLYALYGLSAPRTLMNLYRQSGTPGRYIVRFWTTQDFRPLAHELTNSDIWLKLLQVGMFVQVVSGIVVLYTGITNEVSGLVSISGAILLSYPLVWAHLVFVAGVVSWLVRPKKLGKSLLCNLLEWQVGRLRRRHRFSIVAVAGSVGKTSTKLAIAHVLGSVKRVQYQNGNYNDRLTVPLVFFGQAEPAIFNVVAWARLLVRNERMLRRPYPYDVVVLELGTDGIGQMAMFAYLRPKLGVITAVAPEHMEYFKDLATVAREELAICDYAQTVLVNADAIDPQYLTDRDVIRYGAHETNYYETKSSQSHHTQKLTLHVGGKTLQATVPFLGKQGASVALAAATVGERLGMTEAEIAAALETLPPTPGRMQVLAGVHGSTIIDDTYNASPLAVTAALDVLYGLKATKRIAILGSMNELGETSAAAHEAVGAYCDPKKLTHVVTIGLEAKKHLAPIAKKAGCHVTSFMDPHRAGSYVRSELVEGAIVLAKGSQNGVFAEEALKPLLADPGDASKLVRQSDYWLRIKRSQFGD